MLTTFDLATVCIHSEVLGRNVAELADRIKSGVGHERLTRNHLLTLAHNVRLTVELLPQLGAPNALKLGRNLIRRLESSSVQWNAVAASEALTTFHEQVLDDYRQHSWVRIDATDAAMLPSFVPWGEEVAELFPEADVDIRSASIALVFGLHTAAVFHLMRVAEVGLKWLAKQQRVTLRENKKPLPINEAMWGKIIDGLNASIRQARQMTAGPKKRARLEAFASAALHCDYMKDIWRNNVSHAHRSYSLPEARVAMQRVRDFMQTLAAAARGPAQPLASKRGA